MKPTQRSVHLLIVTNIATLAFFLISGFSQKQNHFTELTAERIDIVSPEGKKVMAIANKQRIAGPTMGGKTYPVSVSSGRENMAGMIFFNESGDEMGGLVFNSFKLPNGKNAGIGHLSFDRFNDNQVLALQYKENSTTVQSGLTLYDRPGDGIFKKSLDLVEEYGSATAERKKEIDKQFSEWGSQKALGSERVFLGSKDRAAQLLLRDSKGRPRARLIIETNDEAKLEFLDEAGKVTAKFPS